MKILIMYDVIIVGNGPAGITSAIYAKRGGANCLVIGKDSGALEKADKIENYYGFVEPISGKDLLENGINQAKRLGIDVIPEEVVSIENEGYYMLKTNKNVYKSKTVILATGTSRKMPNIKGVKEFEGKGISYCATCDAFFYRGKDVAVLGSGDYALHEAQSLLPVVNSVTMLTNGEEAPENRSSELKIIPKRLREFRGEQVINSVEFEDNTNIQVSGVFIAQGVASSTDFAKKLGAIINNNYIVVDENMMTNVKGLFAAGDCTGGLLQISKAIYDGAKAGIAITNFLRSKN